MAYTSPDTPRNRVAAFGAVAALHGVMALAIFTGFAGGIIKVIEKETFPTWKFADPIEPPKPVPTIEPTTKPSAAPMPQQRETAPQPEIALPREPFQDILIDTGPLPTGGLGGDTGPVIAPLPPKPVANFTPRPARPLTAPGKWVSDADYPTSALRRGEQGMTGFEITVGPDGRVRDCRITRSSGSADLDAATCAKVTLRASFAPASDAQGEVTTARYTNAIRWEIPQ